MEFSFLKPWIFTVLLTLPLMSYAQSEGSLAEIFKSSCKSAWMKDTEKVTNKVAYKDFGEKYCNCMADKPMETDDQMKKSAHLCMSQTLLVVTMNALEEDPGLDNLTEGKISAACVEKWNVIYTGLTGDSKPQVSDYCSCAAPKLNAMNTDRENLTDEEWQTKVNGIAESCADVSTDKPSKSTSTT